MQSIKVYSWCVYKQSDQRAVHVLRGLQKGETRLYVNLLPLKPSYILKL